MKKIKSPSGYVCAVKYKLFSIAKDQREKKAYFYYLRYFGSSNVGDQLIWNSNQKSKVLNKYTLPALGIIYSLVKYVLTFLSVLMYLIGYILYHLGMIIKSVGYLCLGMPNSFKMEYRHFGEIWGNDL